MMTLSDRRKLQYILELSLAHLFFRKDVTKMERKKRIEKEVIHRIAVATLALKDGDADKSNRMLVNTVTLAEENNFSEGIIAVCDVLSSLAMKSGNFEDAKHFLLRALNNLGGLETMENDHLRVSFYLKLSRVHSDNGESELAELGFKNCLHLHLRKLADSAEEETFLLWMSILYWYGKFLLGQRRFDEAKLCFKDCYTASENVRVIKPNQVMVVLYNLGETCQMLEEYDEAAKYFHLAIKLDAKGRNPDLAYFFLKLCEISMWKKSHREAILWCNQGRKFAKKFNNIEAEKATNACLEKLENLLLH